MNRGAAKRSAAAKVADSKDEAMDVSKSPQAFDVEAIRREFPILSQEVYGKPLVYLDNAASAQKTPRRDRSYGRDHGDGLRECASRPASHGQCRNGRLRGGARDLSRIPQRGIRRRDRLHPQRHGGLQPRRQRVWPDGGARSDRGGGRDHPLDHGAPFQHRALAFPARAQGCRDQMGAGG